ncbi:ABC transporter substrate-binding protein, partial [Chloroflexota bacterium]
IVTLTLTKLDGTTMQKSVEAPMYGGTVVGLRPEPDTAWDDFFGSTSKTQNSHLVVQELATGDWYRGPAGTEESEWWGRERRSAFETGYLAESWEIPDAETIIFHIRKGMHWQDIPPMNGREFTADDVVYNMNRIYLNPKTKMGGRIGIGKWFVSATATDKYTVLVKGKEEKVGISLAYGTLAEQFNINPPEVIEQYGDMKDWKHAVGTGPFIVVDSVEGSSTTFKRNPNYWQMDPLFPDNRLPYIDNLKMLVITDVSTQYAALRTGKLDDVWYLSREDSESLLKSNPELMMYGFLQSDVSSTLWFNTQMEPFDDIKVRRALLMAVDQPTILRDYLDGQGQTYTWLPDVPDYSAVYRPLLAQLPESSKELFEYHPDKAKQLLAEAGYPNGFKFTAVLNPSQVDMASIFKSYLDKIGVDMELDVREYAVYESIIRGDEYQAGFEEATVKNLDVTGTNYVPGDKSNYPKIDDPVINEIRLQLTSFELMQNQAEINRLTQELVLHMMGQAYNISPPTPMVYHMWQPWVKNHFGLESIGKNNYGRTYPYAWVDQELKAEILGR